MSNKHKDGFPVSTLMNLNKYLFILIYISNDVETKITQIQASLSCLPQTNYEGLAHILELFEVSKEFRKILTNCLVIH